MLQRYRNAREFADHAGHVLGSDSHTLRFPRGVRFSKSGSGVLLILGQHPGADQFKPCIILTSAPVGQAGRRSLLSGGSISPLFDVCFAELLTLPLMPLGRWPYWRQWRGRGSAQSRRLALLLATGLRESFEEMRLLPLGSNSLARCRLSV